jgi:hypothetical protein
VNEKYGKMSYKIPNNLKFDIYNRFGDFSLTFLPFLPHIRL